jgi:hypothetical protein
MRRLAVWSWPSMHLPPETYLGAIWPAQAQPALRGLVRAWHAARDTDLAAIPAGIADPLILEFRRAVRSTLGECLPRDRRLRPVPVTPYNKTQPGMPQGSAAGLQDTRTGIVAQAPALV